MKNSTTIAEVLSGQLEPQGGLVGLAEKMLSAIVCEEHSQEFDFDADIAADQQAQRLIRPLLACLATLSANENGTCANHFFGPLQFRRPGPNGPIWIVGEFDNRMGSIWIKLRRSTSPILSQGSTMQPAEVMTAPPATTK